MNKKNFNQLSKEWAEKAESYLQGLVIDVLVENDLSVAEFCEFTDIDFDEMDGFLTGKGNLSMQSIGKVLIGCNLSLEVKHVSDTEIGSYDLDDDEEEPKKKEFVSYDDIKKPCDDEEEIRKAKKEAFNAALDKIEYHSGEPTFDDGWSAAMDYMRKKTQPKQEETDDDLNDAIHKTMEEHPERIMNLLFAILDRNF